MRILALNGSPTRKKGMTDIMMNLLLNGARDAGASTEYVSISEKKINYCTGCFNCWIKHPGKCRFNDDMPALLEDVKNSDVVLVGTPLYVDGMSAQTKTVFDRLIPLVNPEIEYVDNHYRHVKRLDRTPKAAFLSVCGFYEMDNFDALVGHFKAICKNLRSEYIGAVLKPSSYTLAMEAFYPDHVKEVKDALYRAGKELVENQKFSQETLDTIAKQPVSRDQHLEHSNIFWGMCRAEGKFLLH